MKKIIFIFLFCFVFPYNANAEFLFGLGYSMEKLPSNNAITSLIAPDGETTGSIYIYSGNNEPNKISFGVAFSGYNLKKWISDYSGRVEMEWSVYQYSGYLCYRVLLGQDKNINPSLGIRAGGSIVPIKVRGSLNYSTLGSNDETNIAPYIGTDLLIPIKNSPLNIFAFIDKTFCKYKDETNVGSLSIGAGLAYSFRSKTSK